VETLVTYFICKSFWRYCDFYNLGSLLNMPVATFLQNYVTVYCFLHISQHFRWMWIWQRLLHWLLYGLLQLGN